MAEETPLEELNKGKGQQKRDVTNESKEKRDVNVAEETPPEELNKGKGQQKRDVTNESEEKRDVNGPEQTPPMVNCDKEGSVIEITPQEQVTDIDHSEIVDLSG